MKKIFVILSSVMILCSFEACTDDDSFSKSSFDILTFSNDTICMDTVFSTVPTSTRTFWVYNKSGDGIRCSKVRLAAGNQSGFRVNVDGEYLSPLSGYQVSDVEIRNKDSVRVFVELTSPENKKDGPQFIEDELIFSLESGVEQRVNLNAYTWDATLLKNLVVKKDTVIESTNKPVVVYGGIRVDSFATLKIATGSTLYFHADAGIDVFGCLITEGSAEKNVVLRGDRTDKMFDYLPYDMVSGQWRGIKFNSSSYNNKIEFTDIHGAFDGIVCDSSDITQIKLQIYNSTIHNCQGYGLETINSVVDIRNTQISNTLNDCVAIFGGNVVLRNCTLAQFYPFDSNRGVALKYANFQDEILLPLNQMDCINTIVTGYGMDQVSEMDKKDDETAFNYRFINSLLRTPKPEEEDFDDKKIVNVIFEDLEDSETQTTGDKHFRKVDIDKQRYDFHLNSGSPAINNANIELSLSDDRDGRQRDELPDIGCYEYLQEEQDE